MKGVISRSSRELLSSRIDERRTLMVSSYCSLLFVGYFVQYEFFVMLVFVCY